MKDFFISYNKADHDWAEWIAWQLEDAGYSTIIQAWDFRPSSNFIAEMNRAASEAQRTIAVLSPEYLKANYSESEWAAAFAKDPTGEKGFLLPIHVKECELSGLLSQIVYIDFVGLDEADARHALLEGVKQSRAKPTRPPAFPSSTRSQPRQFPGTAAPQLPSEQRPFGRYWILIIGFILVAFLLAVFLIQRNNYSPSQTARQDSAKEKDRDAPRLEGKIEQIVVDSSRGGSGIQLFVLLSIRNTGGPSIADNFSLIAKSQDFIYKHSPAKLPDSYTLTLDDKTSTVTLHPQDSIEEKAAESIRQGYQVRGWLRFTISEDIKPEIIKPEILRQPKTQFTIYFKDILGQTSAATYKVP